MRISWRELDWISERDRHEIERRMHTLGGNSGLLDRVDFAGRAPSASGAFEIRITANAAKRQIIAVRRDSQRVKAFNSAFEALERSVMSVLKTQPAKAELASAPARAPALALPDPPQGAFAASARRVARPALAAVAALSVLALVAFWWGRGAPAIDVGARGNAVAAEVNTEARKETTVRADFAVFSAVANFATATVEEPAYSAVARAR
jgi:hypothetical protein